LRKFTYNLLYRPAFVICSDYLHLPTLINLTCFGGKDQAWTLWYSLIPFKEDPMKDKLPQTHVWNDEATNLLLFPDESSVSPAAPPLPNAPLTLESLPPRNFPLSLAQITAEWRALLKRLGRRRRVLETILTAGQPIRLTADTLIVGFPPHRRFHQELLDMPDYRSCVEEELARTFRMRLSVVTAMHPESRGLRRNGVFGKTPA
jgi:hypothetical protein